MSAPVSQEAWVNEEFCGTYSAESLVQAFARFEATARKQALEKAAKVAEASRDLWQAYSRTGGATIGADRYDDHECDLVSRCCGGLATAIRALGSQNDG